MKKKIKGIIRKIGAQIGKNYPKQWVYLRYFIRFHKPLHLKQPKNLNEKILHLSLMTNTEIWSKLTDKYKVREYIEECGYKDSLVELYGVWTKPSEINFKDLPSKFVLKTNHGSGEIILVNNKDTLNKEKTISYFKQAIEKPYGEIEGGKHYWRIRPYIIAEQLLINDNISKLYSKSIIDYKIWCFNGKAYYTWVCCNRDIHGAEVLLYDRAWHAHPEYSIFTKHYRRGKIIPQPNNYKEMLAMAENLAQPFPCVRIDLYNIAGKIYFGEITFTSLGGMMNYFTSDFLNKAGDLIKL